MDDPLGNTKSVDDMVFDEANNIGSFNFGERYSFSTLQKLLGYSKDKPWPFTNWGLIGPITSIP